MGVQKPEVIKSVQYLRGMAALIVVFFHFRHYLNDAWPGTDLGDVLFANGAFGVDLFFIISGFIICHATQRPEPRPLLAYSLKRFFRIYPLMLLSLGVFYVLFGSGDFSLMKSLLPLHADYTEKGPFFGYNMLSPVWTLSYEICFYLLFFIGLSVSPKYRQGITTGLILLAFVLLQLYLNEGVKLSAYTDYDYVDHVALEPVMAMLSSPMILEFVYGIALYKLYTHIPSPSDAMRRRLGPLMLITALASLVLCFSGYFYGHGPLRWGLPCAVLIFSLLMAEKFRGMPDAKWLFALGNISFSLYLVHIIIIKAIRKYDISFGQDGVAAFIMATLVSILAATLVYRLVEIKSISVCRTVLKNLAAPATQPAAA